MDPQTYKPEEENQPWQNQPAKPLEGEHHQNHHEDHEHHHDHDAQPQPEQWQPSAPAQPWQQPAAQPWQPPQPAAQPEPMPTPGPMPTGTMTPQIRPIPVVRVLSPVGVEYVFLTILLFVGAGSLIGTLLALVNGFTDFQALSFPTATLLITVPAFAGIFLHLKKMELRTPELKLDPSKRRSTQFTQIVAFIVSLFALIALVYSIFAKLGGVNGISIGKVMLDVLCVLVVSGGILAYYWRDEHRA